MSEEINPAQSSTEDVQKLWQKARHRAAFKIHLIIFVLVNALFWVIWYFVFRNNEATNEPVMKAVLFMSIAWLIILIGHYVFVYVFGATFVEKELKKLKNQIEKDKKEIERLKTIAEQKKAELLKQSSEGNN